jgi:hypothetical protein
MEINYMFETVTFPGYKSKFPEKKSKPAKQENKRPYYPNELLNKLADEIMYRLRTETRLANLEKEKDTLNPEKRTETRSELFSKISGQVFSENGIEKDFYSILRSQIGKILTDRKPKIPITKSERDGMISGAKKLEEENRRRGIDENGDPLEEEF